jgi:glucan biosynthesis protein C
MVTFVKPNPGRSRKGTMKDNSRVYYLDNLRIALTILVMAHHVGQAYGPTGGYWPVQEAARAAILGPFFTVNRSFFMSLFFMISGYLMVGAYDRNGARAFTLSRLRRLGVPVLCFALAMIPLRIFLFGERISSWMDLLNAGHLWYLEHLLLFSLGYALWRTMRGVPSEGERAEQTSDRGDSRAGQADSRAADRQGGGPPSLLAILAFALVIALASALVRIWSPIDRWFNLLGFFRVAFADVPRDLGFFVAGILAYPRRWFERYPQKAGFVWLALGITLAAAWYAYALVLHRLVPVSPIAMAVIYPLWEALLCCGLCIGLLVLFRQAADMQSRFGKTLARSQYSAYFWHPILIVPLQMAVLAVAMQPLVKFLLVTAVAVPLVFLWSHLLLRRRALRTVF